MPKRNLPKGFTCTCGVEHTFPLYVFAHWDEPLIHTCDCGAKHTILQGKALRTKESKRRAKASV